MAWPVADRIEFYFTDVLSTSYTRETKGGPRKQFVKGGTEERLQKQTVASVLLSLFTPHEIVVSLHEAITHFERPV